MAKRRMQKDPPQVIVNGTRIDAIEPELKGIGDASDVTATASFRIGTRAPAPLYFIGSNVALQLGEYGPSTFRVVGIHEQTEDQNILYQIRLREVVTPPSIQETMSMIYGSVFHTIMNRIRLHSILELIEDKGIANETEYDQKLFDVADRYLIQYASEIVSQSDAKAMRDHVLSHMQQGASESSEAGSTPQRS
ncbi:MAG: hypothetical protein ACRDJW_23355 [Thermomicrobiales bacterium]